MFVINKTANLDLYKCPRAQQNAVNTAMSLTKNPFATLKDKELANEFLKMSTRQNHDFAAIMKAAKRTVDRERRILR